MLPPNPSFVITPRTFDCRHGAEDPRFICHGGHWHPSQIGRWFKHDVSALCVSVCEEECPWLLTGCCTRRLMPSWQPYLLRMKTSPKYIACNYLASFYAFLIKKQTVAAPGSCQLIFLTQLQLQRTQRNTERDIFLPNPVVFLEYHDPSLCSGS